MSGTGSVERREILEAVRTLSTHERKAYLDDVCADDSSLRAEVESLLRHDDATSTIAFRPEVGDGGPRRTERSDPDVTAAVGPAFKAKAEPRLEHVGRYRIIREIGKGGMGVVYLAQDEQFRRHVAVKVLKRGMDTEDVLRRFELERQLLAALNHPGIAQLYDAGETDDGLPYFVMEHVEGLDLEQYCDVHRLDIHERLGIFQQVCEAVHHAHQNLVVHRDLKPSNILVTKDGQPKLLDFGIAKLINPEYAMIAGDPTAPELRVMTPQYASPEQVRGHPVGTSSDVYSLGVLLYELLSGHRPYRIKSRVRAELERVICEEEPERPSTAISRVEEDRSDLDDATTSYMITPESVSRTRAGRPDRLRRSLAGDIDNIVLMAMRKEPQRRYASAKQLSEDIARHLHGMPVIARPDTVGYRTTKFIKRNRVGVAAAALFALSLMGGVAGTAWGWREADTARDAEAQQRLVAEAERDLADERFERVRELARVFMFDFHDAIQTLDGSLPAREMLVTEALKYLDGLSEDVGDDVDLKLELASAYDRVGDIRGGIRNPSLGNTGGALENYDSARLIREELVSIDAENPTFQRELSTSHIRIADLLMHTGDVTGALDAHRQAVRIREDLAAKAPDDADRQADVAVALNNLGAAQAAVGDNPAAVTQYERSLAIREKLAAHAPDDPKRQRAVSVVHLRLGGQHVDMGEYDAAIARFDQGIAIREQLLEQHPDSGRAKRDLAVAHYTQGRAYARADRPEAAAPHIEHFVTVARERIVSNPQSARAKRDLASGLEMLGWLYLSRDEFEQAADACREYQAIITPLAATDPSNTQYQTSLAVSHESLGEVYAASGDYAAAVASGKLALAIIEPVAKADGADVRRQATYARIMSQLGAWLAASEQRAEARRRLEGAWSRYRTLLKLQPDDVEIRTGSVDTLQELSGLLAASQDGQGALAYAEQAISLSPDPTPSLLRDLAVTHAMTGDRARAIEVTEEALRRLDIGGGDKTDADSAKLRDLLEADLRKYRGE